MAKYLHTFQAEKVDVNISRENQTVTFSFLQEQGDAYAVTTPLLELRRLHSNVSEQLRKEPQLLVPVSRK